MENEMSSGYLRFMSLLRAEESGEESQFDDADLIHAEVVEAPEPIAAPSEPPITAPVTTPAPPVPVATSKRVLTIVWRDGEPVEWSDGQKIRRGKKPRKVSK